MGGKTARQNSHDMQLSFLSQFWKVNLIWNNQVPLPCCRAAPLAHCIRRDYDEDDGLGLAGWLVPGRTLFAHFERGKIRTHLLTCMYTCAHVSVDCGAGRERVFRSTDKVAARPIISICFCTMNTRPPVRADAILHVEVKGCRFPIVDVESI